MGQVRDNGLFGDLQDQFKDTGIRWGSDKNLVVEKLPLGIPTLDNALAGGFAFGRMALLIGQWSSGKTLISTFAIKAAQEQGLQCAVIDAERSFDPEWATTLGVNVDNLMVARPLTGEEAFELLIALCKAKVGLVVLDSLAACLPSKQEEEDMSSSIPALQARMANRGFLKVNANNQKTCVLVINQLRESVGVTYGSPEVIPGGKGQRFYGHQIIRVRRGEFIDEKIEGSEKKHRVGYNLRIIVEKSRQGAPFQEAEVPFYYAGVLDQVGGLVPLAIDLEVIKQAGSFYTIFDERIRGKKALIDYIKEHDEVYERLRRAVEEVPSF